jgi:hypothetical protein
MGRRFSTLEKCFQKEKHNFKFTLPYESALKKCAEIL